MSPECCCCHKYKQYKLCRVKHNRLGDKGIPFVTLHDGRTVRFPDPDVKVNDTVMLDIETNKIIDSIKFEVGNLAMVVGGRNTGRVGIIINREKHKGSFDMVHIKDAGGHTFATRLSNVFIIGKSNKPMISLPKGKGIKLSIVEEQAKKFGTLDVE